MGEDDDTSGRGAEQKADTEWCHGNAKQLGYKASVAEEQKHLPTWLCTLNTWFVWGTNR